MLYTSKFCIFSEKDGFDIPEENLNGNAPRIRPFLRRDDAVLQGAVLNPERDLFKSVIIKRQQVLGMFKS